MTRLVLAKGTYTMRLFEIEMPRPHKKIWRVGVKFIDHFDSTHQTWLYIAANETAWLLYHGLCALGREGAAFAIEVGIADIPGTSAYYNTIKPDWKFGKVEEWQGDLL